ncbi:MAG: hypothetical protein IKV66_12955 [Clostridia bacterium]|nr:hypothetical protein [Clostridia bacterium]
MQTSVLVFASSAPLLLQKKRQSQAEKEREKKSRKEKEAKRKEEKKRERKRPNPNPNALTKSKSKSISEMPFEPTDRYRVRAARSKTDGIGVDNGTDDEGWVGFGMEGWMKP